jgi:hypothetical protein
MPDQADALEQLADLVGTADPNSTAGGNMGAGDRGIRSGRRFAADRRLMAQDRALRAQQSADFNKRWGNLTAGVGIDWPTR